MSQAGLKTAEEIPRVRFGYSFLRCKSMSWPTRSSEVANITNTESLDMQEALALRRFRGFRLSE